METEKISGPEAVWNKLRSRKNWGRWGEDDQRGAINLVTPERLTSATHLVHKGRSISLAREFPKTPSHRNPNPAQKYIRFLDRGSKSGAIVEYLGIEYHGFTSTHIDAICHIWGPDGLWGGRKPSEEFDTNEGSKWADIAQWRDGIITRAVLLDVPRFRGVPFVTLETPVYRNELEEIARSQDLSIEPGDAVVIHMGRDAWEEAHPEWTGYSGVRPGLHLTCLDFVRDHDVAMVVWDFNEARPVDFGIPWSMHYALPYFGLAIVHNAVTARLADICKQEGNYQFLLIVVPLYIPGASGSPVNPLAVF